jgi:serine/threonine protein kinase/tetratricopeptide (TPR) repeat protein
LADTNIPRHDGDDETSLGGLGSKASVPPVVSSATADADATTLQLDTDATRIAPPPSQAARTPPGDDDQTRAVFPSTGFSPPTGMFTQRTGSLTGGGSAARQGPVEVGMPFGPRYHIIRELGVGGMGAVYQAWDAELGVVVAVKVIRPEIAADPDTAVEIERRFKRELLLARQVTHPNVVRIHDLGEVEGIKYITMPYIEGEDLATILKEQGTLPVPRALRIARGVVSALVSAHEAGVVHRDLKPANVMVGADDQPMLMDFGIARSSGGPEAASAGLRPDLSRAAALTATKTMAGAIVGTVAYMAPEQARGEAVDQRADIYALGLILYDMLAGRRAERAVSAIEELQGRMQAAPPPAKTVNPAIPEALDAIIRRCLEPDAAKRFQKTVDLEHALARLDENGKPLPIMRRYSRRTLVAAAIVIGLALGGTYYTASWLATPDVPPEPISLVIADIQNNTQDPSLNGTLEQTVRRGLESASFISAYDRSRIRAALGVQPPERLDETAARELAVKQGLPIVLAGSIDTRGSGYEISIRAIESVTGKVIATRTERAPNKGDILARMATLMTAVRGVLGDNTSRSDQLFAMRSLSASSLEVVSLYAAAVQAQAAGNFEEARQRYLKAVELDPNFGLGYQGLAAMSRNLGRLDEADTYIKEAFRHLDGMTERERFATRGYYYRTIGDNQKCADEYAALLTRYPSDSVAYNQRAGCLYKLRKMSDAQKDMESAVGLLENHAGYRTNLALFAALAGNFERAEEEIRKVPQPTTSSTLVLAYSQVGRGLVREATETYQKLATMGPAGASSAASGLGDLAIYEGRFSEAVKILRSGAAADLAAKNASRAAIKLIAAGHAELMRGQRELARAAADEALALSKAMAARFLAARLLTEAGALDAARPVAQALAEDLAVEPHAHGLILQGMIALKEGKTRDAVRLLTEANTLLDTWFGHFELGRAYLEAKAYPEAEGEFDRCLARRGEVLTLMDEGATFGYLPPVYYYQGRAREGFGTAGFANSYREYLKIRGGSTEDPLVPDVRKRAGN